MAAVTFGVAGGAAAAAEPKPAETREGFFTRVLDAIAQSQMKRAERDIMRFRDLLAPDCELRERLNLPFNGR